MVSWGDDRAMIMNLNLDTNKLVDRVIQKSRNNLRATEQAKELLGKLAGQIIESHPSRRGENDQDESEGGCWKFT